MNGTAGGPVRSIALVLHQEPLHRRAELGSDVVAHRLVGRDIAPHDDEEVAYDLRQRVVTLCGDGALAAGCGGGRPRSPAAALSPSSTEGFSGLEHVI